MSMNVFKRAIGQHWAIRLLLVASCFVSGLASAETYEVNFRDTDIHELIKFVADRTKKTIVIDPKVKGKVKVVSSKRVDEEELYELFLSILEVHGYAAIDAGGVVRIVAGKSARSQPVKVIGGKLPYETSEVITHVIQLDNVNAAKLIPILRPLVPQQAHMAAYAQSNAIIISDTTANIARIKKVIEHIDKSSFQETEVIPLKHASADEAVRILEKLEKSQPGDSKSSPQKRIQLVADKRTNSVIMSGAPSSRQRIKSLIKHLDSPLERNGNAKVVFLHYAKAKELAEVLGKVSQNMAKLESEKGDKKNKRSGAIIEADETTNALIITAEADVMSALDSIIASLDIPRAQVLVEAIIVEVEDSGDKKLGIEWMFANDHDGFGSFSDSGLAGGVASSLTEDDVIDRAAGLGAVLAGTPGGTFGVGKLKEDGTSLIAVLNALEDDTESNILSTPSLLTLDNNEATIVVGKEVPFVTGSYTATGGDSGSSNPGNPFQTIEREDVGITLTVTPHINEGDGVILEISQEVSSLQGVVAERVITNQRKIETSVLTGDGEVVVLGGLMSDEVQESERKIPILGDIPLLGRLFRTDATKLVKTNLLVFIRVTIIRDEFMMREVSSGKYEYIRDKQQKERKQGINLYPDGLAPMLPEWEDQLRQIEEIREKVKQESEAAANTQASEQ